MEQVIQTPAESNEDALFTRVWERIKSMLPGQQDDSAFSVRKDLQGKWRWVATFTNNFRDRDGEIISEKALDGYLDRVNKGFVPMPELWIGHIEGTKHGQADMVFGVGNFVVASGTFDNTPIAKKAIEYYRKYAAKTPLSHGFTFPTWALKDGVYEVVNTFEITTLPPPLVASNPYTDLEITGMKQISPEQLTALSAVIGREDADKLVATRQQQSEDAKAAGEAFKDFANVTDGAQPTEEAPTPTADVKPLATMIVDLHEGMGELLSLLTTQGKALKSRIEADAAKDKQVSALETQVKDLTTALKAVQTELGQKPKAASAAQETVIEGEAADKAKAELPKETDNFWKA